MSRRGNNNVRGPTSALTEFLRESGINPALIARRVATRNQGPPNEQQPVAGPSTNNGVGSSVDNGSQSERPAPDATPGPQDESRVPLSGYVSDQLDEPEERSPVKKTRTSKRKVTAAAKARARKKAKEDGDYQSSSDDEYTALSKGMRTMGATGNSKPPVGSFESCAKCTKQFTVTRYTVAADPPPGYLCHDCVKAAGIDPFKKPVAPKKRKLNTDKRDFVNFEERRLPTLVSLCVELVSKHIDDIEALGNIGSVNMDEISKALAKNRSLNSQNAHLFYDVRNKALRFYDATHLTPPAFTTLAGLNPNLAHLHLDFCGRLTSPVLECFASSLPHLTSITLLGPFLVRVEAWIEFFRSKPDLRSFRITQSPRFDSSCARQLAESCTKLEELQLREVGLLSDEFIEPLCALSPLKVLDLANPGIGIDEDGWIKLLKRHGRTLETFNPSWHTGFTGAALRRGLGKHARLLSELILEGCESLADEDVARFFRHLANNTDEQESVEDTMDTTNDVSRVEDASTFNPPLRVLSLARNDVLSDATLTALLEHSGSSLTCLSLNGLRSLSTDALVLLKCAVGLRRLDLSWCREVDDFVMKEIVSAMPKLEEVKLWGCSRVKGNGWAGKRGLKIHGVEPNARRR
ncbi:RNI-like protein [Pisolithus croceorrhizus]|nr:RNI-like protein [Pisolithus croceorrhizus]